MTPATLDCSFKGLVSGFYSDFIPIQGVTTPYQTCNIAGPAERINVSYLWTRVGDVVTLNGTAVISGDLPKNENLESPSYMEMKLPIPISENSPVFSGVMSYISTAVDPHEDYGVGTTIGRGANARDPRFFGSCNMVTSMDMNQSTTAQWNNFKINVYPKEWTRDTFRLQWNNTGDNSPDAQLRFHVSYSLAPIMPNGGGTTRYVVDRKTTTVDPGNWN